MHGLRTSSVLVLDDSDDDALKIQKSLALRGIGAVLVPGGPGERRPETSLVGIRVAVLDIHLGIQGDAPDQVRHTKNIVNQLIDRENGPFVAVVWTGNPEDFELFEKALQEIDCPPVRTVPLEKTAVLALTEDECAKAILDAIANAVMDAPPLEFANLWEQIVRDAANDTIVSLALAETPQGPDTKALAFLAALLKSEANKSSLDDDAGSMKALLAALNPVHFDKVEERSANMDSAAFAAVAAIRENASKGSSQLTAVEQAQLNASLLFDQHATGFGPGRLYGFDQIRALRIGSALPEEQAIRAETVDPNHVDHAGSLPIVFLEVSAACDHQQGKIRAARLLAGVAFSASTFREAGKNEDRVTARIAEYLRPLGPTWIPEIAGLPSSDVVIVWNAHYPVSVSASRLANRVPIGRFREPLLADIRAWLGYQAGRPGYASIR